MFRIYDGFTLVLCYLRLHMFIFSLLLACAEKTPDSFEGVTSGETYFVRVETTPSPIPFNEYFSTQVQVFEDASQESPLEDITVAVNATMPAHEHGMNENPEMSGPENGVFLAEGLKWHMEGEWELAVYVETENITFTVDCCSE